MTHAPRPRCPRVAPYHTGVRAHPLRLRKTRDTRDTRTFESAMTPGGGAPGASNDARLALSSGAAAWHGPPSVRRDSPARRAFDAARWFKSAGGDTFTPLSGNLSAKRYLDKPMPTENYAVDRRTARLTRYSARKIGGRGRHE